MLAAITVREIHRTRLIRDSGFWNFPFFRFPAFRFPLFFSLPLSAFPLDISVINAIFPHHFRKGSPFNGPLIITDSITSSGSEEPRRGIGTTHCVTSLL